MTSSTIKPTVVVGVDGSAGAQLALDWAIAKSGRFGDVTPVATYSPNYVADGLGYAGGGRPLSDLYRESCDARLGKALVDVDEATKDRALTLECSAGIGLVDAAKTAALLVVGSRGRSAIVETLLGSVGSYCSKHSEVPVAIIPPETPADGPLSWVVVGVDGSANSVTALRWAIDHVDPGGRVEAIGTFNFAAYGFDPLAVSIETLHAETKNRVDGAVAELGKVRSDIELTVKTVEGDPRTTLRKAASDADLLVIGARGHRGVPYLLLGSVATSLSHHPTVATIVVPHPETTVGQ